MGSKLRWGIVATGRIAGQFARGLKESKSGVLQAVGSRTLESATAFTNEHGGRPCGSYEEVWNDPEVDVVYIATPHHLHAENTISAARAGKGILCEKPFTLNLQEAEEALRAVKDAGVFFMEAFMYRCHPQTLKTVDLVRSGAIGEVSLVSSEFGFNARRNWNNFRLDGAVGGGALMDVGTYCVSFSRLIAAAATNSSPVQPETASYTAKMNSRGYDEVGAGCLRFENGVVAHFGTAIHQQLENRARVFGTLGSIEIDAPWKCFGKMRVLRDHCEPEELDFSSSNDELYAIEADAVAEFFQAGECPYMTIEDTLANMATLDRLRG